MEQLSEYSQHLSAPTTCGEYSPHVEMLITAAISAILINMFLLIGNS